MGQKLFNALGLLSSADNKKVSASMLAGLLKTNIRMSNEEIKKAIEDSYIEAGMKGLK